MPRIAIAAIEAQVGGRISVAALDTATGQHVAYRPNERFPMCSTFATYFVGSTAGANERTATVAELTRVVAEAFQIDHEKSP
jgi:beta-lactamase class A